MSGADDRELRSDYNLINASVVAEQFKDCEC